MPINKKNIPIRKLVRQLHLMIAIPSSIVVFIVSLTGFLYAFKPEIIKILNPQLATPPTKNPQNSNPISSISSISSIPLIIQKFQTQFPQTNITSIQIQNGYLPIIRSSKNPPLFLNVHQSTPQFQTLATDSFFRTVVSLHRNLLLGKIGSQIVGYSTLLFVFSLITGLILWYPKKNKKNAFKINWGNTWAKRNFEFHKKIGFYSLFFLLIIALTGLFWSFSWLSSSFYYLLSKGSYSKNPIRLFTKNLKKKMPKYSKTASLFPIDQILSQAQSDLQYPHTNLPYQLYILLPSKRRNYFMVIKQKENSGSRDRQYVFYQPASGQKIRSFSSQDYKLPENFDLNYNYHIHTGRILGLPGQILAALAALIGTTLPVTGFVIWLRRIKKQKIINKKQKIKLKTPSYSKSP